MAAFHNMLLWSFCQGSYRVMVLLCLWSTISPAKGAIQQPFSSTTSPPDSATLPALCVQQEDLNGTKGYIDWVEDNSTICSELKIWTLQVSPGQGTVLLLRKLYMRQGSYLTLSSYNNSDEQSDSEEIYTWREDDYTSRITIVRGGIMLVVHTPHTKGWPLTLFTFKYAVYPLTTLPQKIEPNITDKDELVGSSRTVFNCSGNVHVPKAIACDGVKHCVGDEDEENCEYRQKGCGDWVPYKDQCLKIEVILIYIRKPGFPFITEPLEADRRCQDKYGAKLATLSEKDGRNLVAKLMHKSGAVSIPLNLRKVESTSVKHRHLYRFLWQWGTKGSVIAHEDTYIQTKGPMVDCSAMSLFPDVNIIPIRCFLPEYLPTGYVCMKPNPSSASKDHTREISGVHLKKATRVVDQFLTKQCADGSVVQTFHQCQWRGLMLSSQWSPNNFPLFQCQYGPPVHYSLVCDGLDDCADGSDETECLFPQILSNRDNVFVCENRQVISKNKYCDGVTDCFDDSDERICISCQESKCRGVGCVPKLYVHYLDDCSYAPRRKEAKESMKGTPVVKLDGYGMSELEYVQDTKLEGYFICNNGLHIPTFLLNNGELDCLQGEDEEIVQENFTCPGFYRCQYYGNCVHPDFVCDGIAHCPNKDDERHCNLTHPPDCTCEGYVCSCQALPWPVSDFWYLRYLDLSGVAKPAVGELFVMEFLQVLNVSFCQLTNLSLMDMPQLKILDLSYNALPGLSSMKINNFVGLTHLNISGNPMVTRLDAAFSSFLTLDGWNHIQHLIMHDMHISEIGGYAFGVLSNLKSLDLRNNKIEKLEENVFGGLQSLLLLQTDDFRLCCSYFHHKAIECHAPVNELSSCNNLLRFDFFRVFLWVGSLLTALGNSGVFAFNVITRKKKPLTSFHLLVSNLCIADFLMGVYMMVIGAADIYFRDTYVANERKWRLSSVCSIAGILAFVSSEVSTFTISLITLDRFLMLFFPLHFHLHLSVKSCAVLCCSVWVLGLLLAAVPFIGQFDFYAESGICLPLPITCHPFSGQTYAFVVFIVLNFLLFLFIVLGQLAIYWAVRKAKAAVKSQRQEEQNSVAQRLFLVVFTDFCCWFPVGLMGILASSGVPIPGEVSVWAAVFVLPLNSALNPFLYTLNSLIEKRNIRKMKEESRRVLSNLKSEIYRFNPSAVEEVILIYLRPNKNIKLSKVYEALRCKQGIENDTVSVTLDSSTQ